MIFFILLLTVSLSFETPLSVDFQLEPDPSCGRSSVNRAFNITEKIINGDRVPNGVYPWLVNIYTETDDSRSRFCSGALISGSYVITANHCFENRDLSKLRIGYGDVNFETMYDNDWFRKVVQVIRGPDNKDIAILKLESPVDRKMATPICLPSNVDTKTVFDKEVIVAGWGSTNGQKIDRTKGPELLEARLIVDKTCSSMNSFYCLVGKTNDGKASNSCYGDSGTPMMFFDKTQSKWFVYGVLSMATVENFVCQPDKFSYHTKVPEFLKWINVNTP